jgi:poly-gamma-glutamate synthesis protein (capsule biosynthesis protein)
MNLETSVTRSEHLAPRKAIHYRMNPANLEALVVAGVDVWTLANNHVLDHGTTGLHETLHTLHAAGLRTAGAGRDEEEARRPVLRRSPAGTVVVAAFAHVSSGVPLGWAAMPRRPGVALLPDLSDTTADAVSARLREAGGATALRVVSLHWGGNWGHHVPREHRRFARRLVDGGVHVVHGHSSHHPRPLEIYRGAVILYGCGDLVNDYEGIGGYEGFRDDLRLLHLVRLSSTTGGVRAVTMVPFQARRLSLWHADPGDVAWLVDSLEGPCARLGTHLARTSEGTISVLTGT